MSDKRLVRAFLVFGLIISLANPLLGALVLFPVCVLWIAKKMNDG